MNRPIFRRGKRAGALAILCLLSAASSAIAAPSFEVELDNDASEVQRITTEASAGQFKLKFGPDVTTDLAVGAAATEVQDALNALPAISSGGGSVSVTADLAPTFKYYAVVFDGGPLRHAEVPQLGVALGSVPLNGFASKVSVTTIHSAGVSRSDRRLDYQASISNVAPADTLGDGSELKCHPGIWTVAGAPTFSYQWLRNGAPISGATGSSYAIVTAEDQSAVIQCQVIATNTIADAQNAADFVGSTRVSNGLIPDPQPATAPPTPPASVAVPAQSGALAGAVPRELTCNAGAWVGAMTFTYRWFRNGVAIGSPVGPTAATSVKLAVSAAEQAPPATFQCTVTGTNAGGSRSKASGNRSTAAPLVPNPQAPNGDAPFVTAPNESDGEVVVQINLPNSQGTSVLDAGGSGWTCSSQQPFEAQPAKATCKRSDSLSPGGSFPVVTIAVALGADLPGHAVALATASGGGAPAPVSDTDEFDFGPEMPFEVQSFDTSITDSDGVQYTQAGGHPASSSASFFFPRLRNTVQQSADQAVRVNYQYSSVENVKSIITDLPRGFVGNALAVPQLCPGLEEVKAGTCPIESIVGGIDLDITAFGTGLGPLAIYAIEPEFGAPAQFAFTEGNSGTVYTFTPHLRADDGYAISLVAAPAPVTPELFGVNNVILCSFGAHTVPGTGFFKSFLFNGCKRADEVGANPVPLVTNPSRCSGQPPSARLTVDSWNRPGIFKSKESVNPLPTGCEKSEFEPEVKLRPTSTQADSPTGLDVEITMPTEGLEDPEGLAQSNLDNAIITFPRGMSINPAAAHGLGSCSPSQVKLGSNAADECPLSSKVGTVEIDTPLIRETLTGNVYVAKQRDNPFNATLGIYLVFSSKKDGITVKVAGRLDPDLATGQLTSVFTENPEVPFSRLKLHFNTGPRAPLLNPPKCGSYAIHSELSPWSAASPANPTPAEIVAKDSVYEVTSGPGGGACPSGGLEPSLRAGLQSPMAGGKSPFVLKLSREDGSQRFSGLEMNMPRGLTAYLKGVSYCADHVLAGISNAEGSGRSELANPSCPVTSQIGTVQAGAGAGPFPFYASGSAYLAGPYKGAPLSIAIVTPAVAGPFDLGNVVVRNALFIDPVTSQVMVKSDPIPTILHGLLLDLRDLRVSIDRAGFTAAPTNCEPMSIGVRVSGEGGASVNVSDAFQARNCEKLAFKPKLTLRLFGGTRRSAHPRLVATLAARVGDANIAGASVALPHSEFLDQAHIRTICTRVQFASRQCPAGAVYGHAEARTPLLDSPVSGPVYLRSSDNPLPDLVAALRGPDNQPIEVVLSGRIDSVNGGIRTSFEAVPDQPVSSFTLRMQGGKKGLLVNSRDICKSVNRATAKFTAHNGRTLTLRPKLRNSCKKAAKQKHSAGRHSAR